MALRSTAEELVEAYTGLTRHSGKRLPLSDVMLDLAEALDCDSDSEFLPNLVAVLEEFVVEGIKESDEPKSKKRVYPVHQTLPVAGNFMVEWGGKSVK